MREQGMTREQRLELLKQIEKDICVCSIESTFLDDAKSCAIHSAIEELEQEPVLDKIRAEILKPYEGFELGDGFRDGYITAMVKVLDIVDKYRESEEKS